MNIADESMMMMMMICSVRFAYTIDKNNGALQKIFLKMSVKS